MITLKLSDLSSKLQDFDVLVVCASFEARCLSVAFALEESRVNKLILFVTSEAEQVSSTIAFETELESRYGSKVERKLMDLAEPQNFARDIGQIIDSLIKSKTTRFAIDITTFTHEAVLILFNALVERSDSLDVTLLYTGAREYSVNESGGDKWLSRGLDYLRSVYGYPGLIYPSKNLHLVILLGFEVERAAAIIDSFEPTLISIGLPERESSVDSTHADLNELFAYRLSGAYPIHKTFTFSASDVNASFKSIESHLSDYNVEFNTVIAPMNTKLSTLAAGLYALTYQDVQLCYAHAAIYNTHGYSTAGDSCFVVSLKELLEIIPNYKGPGQGVPAELGVSQ